MKRTGCVVVVTFLVGAILLIGGCEREGIKDKVAARGEEKKAREKGKTEVVAAPTASPDRDADADEPAAPGGAAARPERQPKSVDVPDLKSAAASVQFQAALQKIREKVGGTPEPMTDEDDRPTGAYTFLRPHAQVEEKLDGWRAEFLQKGAYVFRHDNSHGIGGPASDDTIVIAPTTDKYVVLALAQTDGANYSLGTGDIIDWLKQMEKTQPFELTEAGFDFCAGRFTTPVKDAKTLAKKMYEFCPDIVDQGVGDLPKLEAELKKGKFYFWWD